ncbi:hypothetical protein WH303_06505 [Comamonas sp. MYb69]
MMKTNAVVGTTSQIIWGTVMDLRSAGQAISRKRLMELSDMPYTKVDDHVSRWIEEGRMRRVVDGVYEVVDPMPEPRAVSVTDLPDGMTLVEIGDQELRLWPTEARALGQRMAGNAFQFTQLQTRDDVAALLVEATVRNRALADRVYDLEREQSRIKQHAFIWTPERIALLGTANDRDIAEQLGIDTREVERERGKRGIPRFPRPPKPSVAGSAQVSIQAEGAQVQ